MTEYSPDVLYPNAILLPVLAFPAWILCIPPFVWHASQRNVAAASLILWIMLINFCNSINPLLWSHDNITEWWDGNVLCDIEVRLFIGSGVGLASCVAMIMRKLATVMDTRNITIAPSRAQVLREKMLDYLWCWAFPALMMLVYYIVQWCRYFLFGISGCVVVYDSSWPSVVLGPMPGTIAICFAAYYAGKSLLSLSILSTNII
jgi:pheromone a factor receptor